MLLILELGDKIVWWLFFSRARSSEKGNDQITPFFFKELTVQ